MTAPLAYDVHGNAIELPPEAAYWRVRRHTGGRPSEICGPDGEPLFIPIGEDRPTLRANGCTGSLRLDAVDEEQRAVDAPAAFVELGGDEVPVRNSAVLGGDSHADLLRVAIETNTRTMEAMQRAQIERERVLGIKEKALTDSQVAMMKMQSDLMIALVERAHAGNPQDPLTVVKQQLEIQKTIEKNTQQRNAGLLPAPVVADDSSSPQLPGWLRAFLPFAPMVATGMQEVLVGAIAKENPAKADQIRRNIGNYTHAIGGMVQGQGFPAPMAMPMAVAQPVIEVVDGEVERPTIPKAIREVLARLDDEEADSFSDYLEELDQNQMDEARREAESMSSIDARVAWARGLIRALDREEAPVVAAEVVPTPQPTVDAGLEMPPQLVPVFVQLTQEEQMAAAQILAALDRGTIDRLIAQLVAMPTDKALTMVRRTIAEARKRAPSVAHRAINAAFREAEAETNGGAS
jgi:hypothetical protein